LYITNLEEFIYKPIL